MEVNSINPEEIISWQDSLNESSEISVDQQNDHIFPINQEINKKLYLW